MLKMSEGLAISILAAGISLSAPAAKADSSCVTERFASLPNGLTTDSIAQKVNNGAAVNVKAVNSARLLVCGDSVDSLRVAEQAIDMIVADAGGGKKDEPPKKDRPESNQIRLFFHRDADGLAKALDKAVGGVEVTAFAPDLLVFKLGDDAKDQDSVRELKRLVTLIDSPRPEITLNAWSVQVSADKPQAVDESARKIRDTVYKYNQDLQDALQRGWKYLDGERSDYDKWSRPFTHYVLSNFARNAPGQPTCTHKGKDGKPQREEYPYCLGYESAFSPVMQPSIMNMIGILAGLTNPDPDAFVNQLEDVEHTEAQIITVRNTARDAKSECDKRDEDWRGTAPAFECFRDQLLVSMGKTDGAVPLARLRAAMADFLFQYKFSIEYIRDFDSYDYAKSAQRLDVELDPLLVAFNHDLVVYLRKLQETLRCGHPVGPKEKCEEPSGYGENGIVTVRTIAGTDSSVSTRTQSSFKTTPPPLANDFLAQLQSIANPLPKNFAANPEAALEAFLNSGKSSTVTLGKDLNLMVSPATLPGASAAELKMTLESKDDANPQQITPDGKSSDDTSNRVAVHSVSTSVRVDSLKLFEISTFSAKLSRGKEPISLVPPLIKLPYVPPLVKYQPKPSKAYHQSFAIVSATILPTAADLLNGLRFNSDKADENGTSIYPMTDDDREKLTKEILKRHRQMIDCIAKTTLTTPDAQAICAEAVKRLPALDDLQL